MVYVANKVDNPQLEAQAYALWNLGLGEPHPVSALHYRPWQFYNALVMAREYGVLDKLLFGSDCHDAVGRGGRCWGALQIGQVRAMAPSRLDCTALRSSDWLSRRKVCARSTNSLSWLIYRLRSSTGIIRAL